jgi:hypothetical protein
LAEQAWKDLVSKTPEPQFSEHYEDGFKDGFCDYLFLGGSGSPPPLPPRRYWKRQFETPEGHLAIGQWYDGFVHGAAAAEASGYRQFVAVPPSLGPVPYSMIDAAPMQLQPAPAPNVAPPAEEVPLPAAADVSRHGDGLEALPPVQLVPTAFIPEEIPTGRSSLAPLTHYPYQSAAPDNPVSAPPMYALPQQYQSAEILRHDGSSGAAPYDVPSTAQSHPTSASSGGFIGPWSGPRAQRLMRDAQVVSAGAALAETEVGF